MGMLLDHGIDALTAVHWNIVLQRLTMIGGGRMALMGICVSTIPFYYMTLEAFYIGILTMPALTGPDDSSLIIVLCSLYTAYYGAEELWGGEVDCFGFGTMSWGHFLGLTLFFFECFSVFQQFASNVWHGRNSPHFEKRYNAKSFIAHASFMIVLVAVYAAYTSLSQSGASVNCTKSMLFAFGGQFLQVLLRLLVSDLTSDIFNPYRRTTLLCWSLMLLNGVSMVAKGQPLINEFALFSLINAITWSAIAHYIYHVLNQLCDILNIKIFSIRPVAVSSTGEIVYVDEKKDK
jgi:hypothetical protein